MWMWEINKIINKNCLLVHFVLPVISTKRYGYGSQQHDQNIYETISLLF